MGIVKIMEIVNELISETKCALYFVQFSANK